MTVTPRFPGRLNAFLPRATGQVIGYIRKPGAFRLLDYVQLVGSKDSDSTGKPVAYYAILDPDAPARVGASAGPTVTNPDIQGYNDPNVDAQWMWDPGNDAPAGNIISNFRWQPVEMKRRAYPYEFDEQTDDSADLPVAQIYREIAAQLAMTVKTSRVMNLLQTAANWDTSQVNDVNVLNGGRGSWKNASSDENSPNFASIRLSVQKAALNIVQATNTTVKPEDLRVLISPNVASALGSTGEIYNYVKFGSFSEERQKGRNQLNDQYGMPKYYAGVEWVIEDATMVTDNPNAAGTAATTGRVWCKNDTTAVMISRKGGLQGVYGAPSFSTVQVFYYKYEMAVEEMHDVWHKKHRGRVVDQFAEVLAAKRAGQLLTNILA